MIRTALFMIMLLPALLSASETEPHKNKTLNLDMVVNAAKKSFPVHRTTQASRRW
jgi:hypothetical protein